MDSTITLRKYLGKEKVFVIPDYQRGYIWGKSKPYTDDLDSVSYILNTIFEKMRAKEPIFLQGMTVTETNDSIKIIDGQQRTTFLYILLKILNYSGVFEIRYDIRDESGKFLRELKSDDNFDDKPEEEYQDIYYFKKSARLILERFRKEQPDERSMIEYLLDNVRFLYINIPDNQARKVFSMMNGNRAKMLQPEIIKAELLRLVSLSDEGVTASDEWQLNLLRSRYAREWDKWIHWWNRSDVKRMFKTSTQLGWLLVAVMPEGYCEPENVTFESFCKEMFGNSRTMKTAKDKFYILRQTQKRFEDIFNDPIQHNKVGAILRISQDVSKFLKYYLSGNSMSYDELHRYYLCSFLSMTHDMIVGEKEKFSQNFRKKFDEVLAALKLPNIYEDTSNGKEQAFRLLLRLNIDEDNLQNNGNGRRFDFSIWDEGLRSLEHIYAKSKVYHQDSDNKWYDGNGNASNEPGENDLKRKDIGNIPDPVKPIEDVPDELPDLEATEHCIGNLVLLYSDDNTIFSAKDFEGKKQIFLVGEENNERRVFFKSRHLLHTVYHFAESKWDAEEIKNYFKSTLEKFYSAYSSIINNLSPITDNAQ